MLNIPSKDSTSAAIAFYARAQDFPFIDKDYCRNTFLSVVFSHGVALSLLLSLAVKPLQFKSV